MRARRISLTIVGRRGSIGIGRPYSDRIPHAEWLINDAIGIAPARKGHPVERSISSTSGALITN